MKKKFCDCGFPQSDPPHEHDRPAWKAGDRARIKDGWWDAGIIFKVLGPAVFVEQWWVPVLDPREDDPTFHKDAGLEAVESTQKEAGR